MQERLGNLGPWVAVHIRRGTYVTVGTMGLAGYAYYARAVALLSRLVGPLPLVVFSDDIDAAKAVISAATSMNVQFIEPPATSRPVESMLLMSKSAHAVIANSTFSWWSAWLAGQPDRVVIYPRPWIDVAGHDDRDLIPPSWIGVGRDAT